MGKALPQALGLKDLLIIRKLLTMERERNMSSDA